MGHALVQNVGRGHYELAVEEPVARRWRCRSASWPWRSDLRRGRSFNSSASAQRNRAGRTGGCQTLTLPVARNSGLSRRKGTPGARPAPSLPCTRGRFPTPCGTPHPLTIGEVSRAAEGGVMGAARWRVAQFLLCSPASRLPGCLGWAQTRGERLPEDGGGGRDHGLVLARGGAGQPGHRDRPAPR
jgi:hypothetical protein